MSMNLAIFPLELIVFPGEQVNLHIFEQRYRDLFNDLKEGVVNHFGIPPVVDNKIHLLGTRIRLVDIAKHYESGEMDVITEGVDVFGVINFLDHYEDKSYAGAEIEMMENDPSYNLIQFNELQDLYEEFQSLLTQRKEIENVKPEIYSYQIAHYSGLNKMQKLNLLADLEEEERQQMMITHFKEIMPSMRNIQETQKRIIANGHFKNLKSFKFQKP
ncbi:MAG: LON peptidase substrate-binding domain-containing protein [Bacteroidetes bacterium]|nr:LON peptidase substrate-binding domain-containing protein [Bacteroidota bacterium]MBU1373313.1 LON peptidase substrate-binding domain-containing protein [Bacteroidota bacterium]MBU1484404.1 LON peptidase substrate-binding domain-containing protein [Bacteroidota bacterium]MBU1762107.1 LON peptidase substrate-binding domain-containing protein [Bacteroidota bacterium]MBU2045418.1 LON peptidase substrate-binding domain-containing protein [Bacteroidota bacterium]